jgi:hypothetical protein
MAAVWAADLSGLEWESVPAVLDPRPAVMPADATAADLAGLMLLDRVDAAVIDPGGYPLGVVTGSDVVSLMAAHLPMPSDPADEASLGRAEPDQTAGRTMGRC